MRYGFKRRTHAGLSALFACLVSLAAMGILPDIGNCQQTEELNTANAQITATLNISGHGKQPTAVQAEAAVHERLKEVDLKARQTAKAGIFRTSYNVSFSNTPIFTGVASLPGPHWDYNFSANYTVSNVHEGAILADELAKNGLTVQMTADVQGQ